MAKAIPSTAAQRTNDGLAKIGNSFANLFRRQHAQALDIEYLKTQNERFDVIEKRQGVTDDVILDSLNRITELQNKLDDLMTQLIAAADEDTDDE